MVWALPRSLATTNGIDSRSFPADTEMIHFSAYCADDPMYSDRRDPALAGPGFPIRTSSDQSVRAAPRSLSQLAASFVA